MVGAIVGVLVGMVGVGGGAIMTPVLIFIFKVPTTTAVATDLVYSASTKVFAVSLHRKRNGLERCVVKFVSIGGVIGAIIGVLVFTHSESALNDQFDKIIQLSIGFLLFLSSIFSLYLNKNHILERQLKLKEKKFVISKNSQRIMMVLVGLVVGIIVSMTSVGGGTIIALFLLYVWKIPVKRVVGTDLAISLIITLISSVTHLFVGNVDIFIMIFLTIGGIIGVYVGEIIHHRMSGRLLKMILTIILLILGLFMIYESI